jgi:hypothetical protein
VPVDQVHADNKMVKEVIERVQWLAEQSIQKNDFNWAFKVLKPQAFCDAVCEHVLKRQKTDNFSKE